MIELIISNGYLYLFLLSFLAATIIPVGSEWLLVALLLQSLDPTLLLIVATVGNVLGGCTTYIIGRFGGDYLTTKVLRMSNSAIEKADVRYQKYGSWSLLLSWVPIIGDPLCFIGGVFKTPFALFLILIFMGKLARYALLTYATVATMG